MSSDKKTGKKKAGKKKAGKKKLNAYDAIRGMIDDVITGNEMLDYECLPSALPSLNLSIRGYPKPPGGYPRGAMTEVVGGSQTGKTRILLDMAAAAQEDDENAIVYFFDSERGVTRSLMDLHNVDKDRIVFIRPMCMEDMFLGVEKILKASAGRSRLDGDPGAIIVDSVKGFPPSVELDMVDASNDGEKKGIPMALQGQLSSSHLPKIIPLLEKTKMLMGVSNQLRTKPGVVYGNPEYSTGGSSWEFYSGLRLKLTKGSKVKRSKTDDTIVGMNGTIQVIKSRVAWCWRKTSLIFAENGRLIDTGLLDIMIDKGLVSVDKATGWHTYGDEKFYKANWPTVMDDNLIEIMDDLEGK